MGAIHSLWEGDLAQRLAEALDVPPEGDDRRQWGEQRDGRKLARQVSERVRHAAG
jgi:malonate decarboxylase gamma subunit